VGQFLGLSTSGRITPTRGAAPGDSIVQVGPVPIEGAAVLAAEARARLSQLDPEMLARAETAADDPGISIVAAALLAAELGASALHDVTEGGLATALWEIADAAGVSLEVDGQAVIWFEPGLRICLELGADPWGVLGSGTLLAAFPASLASSALAGLRGRGHAATPIARVAEGSGVRLTTGEALARFEPDEVARLLA
jgi:hydrogenase maturation factor